MDITQDMINQAGQEEGQILAQSPAVLQANNQHLHNRVVVLRALVNEQSRQLEEKDAEIEKLQTRRQPTDRQSKKTVAKKAAVPPK